MEDGGGTQLVERHAVAGPEGNQRAQLVAKLRNRPHEAATELGGRALGDV